MKCVAIDDEQKALEVIKLYVQKIDSLELLDTFTDPVAASNFVEGNKVDLIFLDINMPGINGFEFIESLTYQPAIIFTTAYSEYAAKSYSVDALDYLVKPIPFGSFLKAVNKLEPILKSPQQAPSEKMISVKSGTAMHRIKMADILYLEAEGNYLKFVTNHERILSLLTMKGVMNILDSTFIQVHRSFIVAINKIEKIEVYQLTVADKIIPIGASFRKVVHEQLGFN
jgi:DNA-binding LytR/AlgR family response regulator